jgi:hypothetical protein
MPPNKHVATRLFREAALLGSTEAQSQIAVSYHYGTGGMIENPIEASRWYRMAAERGRPESQAQIGIMLMHGLPDEEPPLNRDPLEAYRWLTKAAKTGNREACHALSECYEFGVENISIKEKKQWYIKKYGNQNIQKTYHQHVLEAQRKLLESSDEDEEKEEETNVPIVARRSSVGHAATLAGWKEADDADLLKAVQLQEAGKSRKKQILENLAHGGIDGGGGQTDGSVKREGGEHGTNNNPLSLKLNQMHMVVKKDLIKAQYFRERGTKISTAINKGEILKVNDGFFFAIATPTAPKTIREENQRKKKERKKKGEKGRRTRMSKYVTKHVPLSTTKKSGHYNSIVTPRLDDGGSNSSRHKTKKKKNKSAAKAKRLPIPPLPTPVSSTRRSLGWTETHNQWQGPQGPGVAGFGMRPTHSAVSSVSQSALVPAAKSSVYPFGGNTVEHSGT